MEEQKATYKKPTETNELAPGIVQYLDGLKLDDRIGEAIRVTTVDEDGWPHAAMLSVGEILAVDARHLVLAIWAHSKTTKNIERTGRISLALVHEGALWEIHLNAKKTAAEHAQDKLAIFAAEVKNVRVHKVDYADVLTSVTYRLHDKDAVVKRWDKQIEVLRACA
jgi:hypothetical protein